MEALFSVWWDGAQAKAEAVAAAAAATRTSENAPLASGQDSEGPVDFRSELAARLRAGESGRSPSMSPDAPRVLPDASQVSAARPGSAAPDTAVREGVDAGRGTAPDVSTCPGEVNENGGETREKRNCHQAGQPADVGPGPFLAAAKAPLATVPDCVIEGGQDAGLAMEASAAGAAAQSRHARFVASPAAGVEAHLPQGRMAIHSAPAAALSPGVETGQTAKAWLQGSVTAVEEADAHRTQEANVDRMAEQPLQADGAETSLQEGVAASKVSAGAQTVRLYEGDASTRLRGQAEEARQENAPAPGEPQVQFARGEDGPSVATADGRADREAGRAAASARIGWPAAPVHRGGTARHVPAQESGRAPGAANGPGLRESDPGVVVPVPAEEISDNTGDFKAHGRGPWVGVEIDIVPRDVTSMLLAEPGPRAGAHSGDGLPEDPAAAPARRLRTQSAPETGATGASALARAGGSPKTVPRGSAAERAAATTSHETQAAGRSWTVGSVSHPSHAEGAKDGSTPVVRVQAEETAGVTVGPRSGDRVMPDMHPQEQKPGVPMLETGAAALPEAQSIGAGRAPGVRVMTTVVPAEDQRSSTGAEVTPQPVARPQPGSEEPGGPSVGAERRTVALVGKGHGGSPTADARALPREHAVANELAGPGARASCVERPAPTGSVTSEPRCNEERMAVTGRRLVERGGTEPASGRPAMPTGAPDPQDVNAARPLPADSGVAQERQAPITARSVIDQIVQRAQLRLGRSEAEMVIDLKPDALGKVHLRITAEPGRVVAEIRAENAVTRQLIEAGLPDLRTALADRGLDLGTIAVSGGFGSAVAWNGARSRWSSGEAGHGPAGAAPRGAGRGGVSQVDPSVGARLSPGGAHLVDCVA